MRANIPSIPSILSRPRRQGLVLSRQTDRILMGEEDRDLIESVRRSLESGQTMPQVPQSWTQAMWE